MVSPDFPGLIFSFGKLYIRIRKGYIELVHCRHRRGKRDGMEIADCGR